MQTAVIDLLPTAEREKYFNHVIDILNESFPSSWTNDTSGYVFEAWETCENCIHHVYALAARARSFKLQPKDKEKFAELLSRAAWSVFAPLCHVSNIWVAKITNMQGISMKLSTILKE